jgi:hypothetical protein
MATEQQTMINGVDVDRLKETVLAVRDNPQLARFLFRCANAWLDAGRNRSTVQSFYGAGREDTTRTEPYVLDNDEPDVLCGTEQAPTPSSSCCTPSPAA